MEDHMTFSTFVYIAITVFLVLAIKNSVKVVPQSQNWLVEKLGKYSRTLEPGLHLITPFYETVSANHKQSIQERKLASARIPTITKDNVSIDVDLAVIYRVIDLAKYVYRVENIETVIWTVVQATVRSVIGKTELDGVQSNRQHLAEEINEQLGATAAEWGIFLTRVEILDVGIDEDTKNSMAQQLNAERGRRATVLEAEGQKQKRMLIADGELYEAQRRAEAQKISADAQAYAFVTVSQSISAGGTAAVDYEIRKLQAQAVQQIANGTNSKIILLPSDVMSSLSGVIGNIANRL